MSSKIKTTIALCCGTFLAIGILVFSKQVNTTNRNNPQFSYTSTEKQGSPVQIITGMKIEIPFEFELDDGISGVTFELAGIHANLKGITLSDTTVSVVRRRAKAKMIFHIASEKDLDAGSHILTILAKDMESGEVIRKGEILVNYNMFKVIAKCSC
ncbi:MAG: hypothetical protein KKE17_10535 [Proteobacteria bacterium]|nr:hypothetical protein [Pseudomonadota bacterium]MBU1710428.1 hypothetical protein [Pseudomonadota bacterium]